MIDNSYISKILTEGETFCLVTAIISDHPDVPPGQKAIVWPDGKLEGSLGSTDLDEEARDLALKALAENKNASATAGGKVRLFFDLLSPDAKLLICGAGHIAVPLARFARDVGFKVTVLDDRADFANPARFPGCETLAEDFTGALRTLTLGPSSYVVVITRGHEHDSECLAEILPKKTAYVGLIGSRRRIHIVLEELVRKGIPEGRCGDIFTPIGLPVGAESPEEIALAIAAEMVCVRRRGPVATQTFRCALKAPLTKEDPPGGEVKIKEPCRGLPRQTTARNRSRQ